MQTTEQTSINQHNQEARLNRNDPLHQLQSSATSPKVVKPTPKYPTISQFRKVPEASKHSKALSHDPESRFTIIPQSSKKPLEPLLIVLLKKYGQVKAQLSQQEASLTNWAEQTKQTIRVESEREEKKGGRYISPYIPALTETLSSIALLQQSAYRQEYMKQALYEELDRDRGTKSNFRSKFISQVIEKLSSPECMSKIDVVIDARGKTFIRDINRQKEGSVGPETSYQTLLSRIDTIINNQSVQKSSYISK